MRTAPRKPKPGPSTGSGQALSGDPSHSIPTVSRSKKHKVPFDFAQGRLSSRQIIAFAMICSGWDDRIEEVA